MSVGTQMPDGTMADRNYIWLSEWQLENINHNHLLPVDLETYRQLQNHIAKALVPLLQVWLYATAHVGFFEKRYRDLCQILNITQYKHPSKIKEKLGPSLNELQKHRYLSSWRIHPTSDGNDFKVVLVHGEKFRADLAGQKEQPPLERETQSPSDNSKPLETKVDRELLHQLMKRGITERVSISLLKDLKPDQQVMDQLEWGDHLVFHSPNKHKFFNPAGLYIHLIKENATPPETFETSRKKSLREAARQAREKEDRSSPLSNWPTCSIRSNSWIASLKPILTNSQVLSKPRKRGWHRRPIGSGSLPVNRMFCKERPSDKSERIW